MKYVENAACVCCFFFLLSPDGISNHIQWLTIKPFILVFVVVLDFLCMNMADSSSKTETWGGRGEGAGGGGDWGAEMSDTQEEWKNNLSPKLKPCDPRAGMKV